MKQSPEEPGRFTYAAQNMGEWRHAGGWATDPSVHLPGWDRHPDRPPRNTGLTFVITGIYSRLVT